MNRFDIFIFLLAAFTAGGALYFLVNQSLIETNKKNESQYIGVITKSIKDTRRKHTHDYSFHNVYYGHKIYEKDTVFVNENSFAEIKLTNGTQVTLNQHTIAVVSLEQNTPEINLIKGQVKLNTKGHVKLKMGSRVFKIKENSKIKIDNSKKLNSPTIAVMAGDIQLEKINVHTKTTEPVSHQLDTPTTESYDKAVDPSVAQETRTENLDSLPIIVRQNTRQTDSAMDLSTTAKIQTSQESTAHLPQEITVLSPQEDQVFSSATVNTSWQATFDCEKYDIRIMAQQQIINFSTAKKTYSLKLKEGNYDFQVRCNNKDVESDYINFEVSYPKKQGPIESVHMASNSETETPDSTEATDPLLSTGDTPVSSKALVPRRPANQASSNTGAQQPESPQHAIEMQSLQQAQPTEAPVATAPSQTPEKSNQEPAPIANPPMRLDNTFYVQAGSVDFRQSTSGNSSSIAQVDTNETHIDVGFNYAYRTSNFNIETLLEYNHKQNQDLELNYSQYKAQLAFSKSYQNGRHIIKPKIGVDSQPYSIINLEGSDYSIDALNKLSISESIHGQYTTDSNTFIYKLQLSQNLETPAENNIFNIEAKILIKSLIFGVGFESFKYNTDILFNGNDIGDVQIEKNKSYLSIEYPW